MGISQRNNNEIIDKITRMQRAHEDHADAVTTVQQFNARLSAKGRIWADQYMDERGTLMWNRVMNLLLERQQTTAA